MHPFSDSDSSDSENGIRFKTHTTRKKSDSSLSKSHPHSSREYNRRSRSPKRDRRYNVDSDRRSKRRSRSRDRPKSSSRDRDRRKHKKNDKYNKKERKKHRHTSTDNERSKTSPKKCDVTENVKDTNSESAKDSYGPMLPPRLTNEKECATVTQKECPSSSCTSEPTSSHPLSNEVICISPTASPKLLDTTESRNEEDATPETDSFDPPVPPKLPTEERYIGPSLPAAIREKLESNVAIDDPDDDPDDAYGPLPIDVAPQSSAHIALEERALQMKLDKLNPPSEVKTAREEWMIELPTVQASQIGLGPRQFRAKAGPDLSDRSSWTDTPETKSVKEKPVDLKKETEVMESHKHDQEQEAMIKNHKKKKKDEKSLLEQHQEKLKQKKEDEQNDGLNVRRPFSREIDLKVNHFDETQKKAIFKKAQLLDDRFSKGQSKYL